MYDLPRKPRIFKLLLLCFFFFLGGGGGVGCILSLMRQTGHPRPMPELSELGLRMVVDASRSGFVGFVGFRV